MSNKSHQVTIVVAVIGLFGTLGAAAISNWNSIVGDSQASAHISEPVRPSFNCARAADAVERMICSSNELSVLDLALANSYRDITAKAKSQYEKSQLKKAQLYWLAEVRNRCITESCIATAYRDRLKELQ